MSACVHGETSKFRTVQQMGSVSNNFVRMLGTMDRIEGNFGRFENLPGTATETVSFWSVFASMAVFAEQILLVLCAVCGVQHFVAHSCSEWRKMNLISFEDGDEAGGEITSGNRVETYRI